MFTNLLRQCFLIRRMCPQEAKMAHIWKRYATCYFSRKYCTLNCLILIIIVLKQKLDSIILKENSNWRIITKYI